MVLPVYEIIFLGIILVVAFYLLRAVWWIGYRAFWFIRGMWWEFTGDYPHNVIEHEHAKHQKKLERETLKKERVRAKLEKEDRDNPNRPWKVRVRT